MIIEQRIHQTTILPSQQQNSKGQAIKTKKSNVKAVDSSGQIIHLAEPIEIIGKLNIHQLQQIDLTDFIPIIGIDEAGRGPLLGSVVVSAVILPAKYSVELEQNALQNSVLALLNDSKKLTEKKREQLFPIVQEQALAYVVASVPASVIDQINILQATMLGMRLSAETLLCQLSKFIKGNSPAPTKNNLSAQLLIDGNRYPLLDMNLLTQNGYMLENIDCQAWVKGDARHGSISAASVLAKVSRDKEMLVMAKTYPNYGIEKHKGYPTKAHLQAIHQFGVLPEHRRSFAPIKQII